MKKALVIISLLMISLAIVCVPSLVNAAVITRVQGPAMNTATSSPLTVTLTSTPTSGNVLIAVVGVYATSSNDLSTAITQTGVTWYDVHQNIQKEPGNAIYSIQIWAGIIGAGASKSVSIDFTFTGSGSGTINAATADICEYSGLSTSYIQTNYCDQFASALGSGNPTSTGTTPTTTYANELWIGAILLPGASQTASTNSFALIDGTLNNGISVAYLENIVTSTGTASSSTTTTGTAQWYGEIVTFPYIPLTPTPEGPIGALGFIAAAAAAFAVWTKTKQPKKLN